MASTACFLHHHAISGCSSSGRRQSAVAVKPAGVVVCKAQKQPESDAVSRRLALTLLIGAAAVGSKVSPADAAYGEAANVFGKAKANTDFIPYSGEGFKLLVPAKWNPSKEVEYPGQVLRFEDNFDTTSNLSVMITPTDKKSITDFGSPEQFLSQVDYLLGKQAYFGNTDSEVTGALEETRMDSQEDNSLLANGKAIDPGEHIHGRFWHSHEDATGSPVEASEETHMAEDSVIAPNKPSEDLTMGVTEMENSVEVNITDVQTQYERVDGQLA